MHSQNFIIPAQLSDHPRARIASNRYGYPPDATRRRIKPVYALMLSIRLNDAPAPYTAFKRYSWTITNLINRKSDARTFETPCIKPYNPRSNQVFHRILELSGIVSSTAYNPRSDPVSYLLVTFGLLIRFLHVYHGLLYTFFTFCLVANCSKPPETKRFL